MQENAKRDNSKFYYDKTEEFKEKLTPIVNELMTVCGAYRLPMFLAVAVAYGKDPETGKEHTTYEKFCLRAETEKARHKDRISDMILRTIGSQTSLPSYIVNAAATLQEFIDKQAINEQRAKIDSDKMMDADEVLYEHLNKLLSIFENRDDIPMEISDSMSVLQAFAMKKIKKDEKDEENQLPPTGDTYLEDLEMIADFGAKTTLPPEVTEEEDMSEWESELSNYIKDSPEDETEDDEGDSED